MSDKIDTKNHPTIKALIEHRNRLEVSDAVFASRHLGISKTTWSQLQSGNYPAEDPTPMLARAEAALQVLIDQSETAAAGGEKAKIIDLPHVRAALNAIKDCYNEPQNRLVLYMGGTGAGKTTLTRRIEGKYLGAAVCLEATESWRGSYYYALMGVADALGMLDTSTNPRVLETQVFERLAVSSIILAIDEGHYCGPAALNLIKAILNKTTTRVVLIAIPALWDRMEKKAYEEAKQLRRRTFAKIVVNEVKLSDCRSFLAAKLPGYAGLNGEEPQVVATCMKAANAFGLYDTLERICDEVRREMGSKTVEASLDRVAAAIKRVEALRS